MRQDTFFWNVNQNNKTRERDKSIQLGKEKENKLPVSVDSM